MRTLSQLAWFDRCLFSGTFYDAMIKHGADPVDAAEVRSFIVGQRYREKPCGIIQITQEFISTPALIEIFEKIVDEFFQK